VLEPGGKGWRGVGGRGPRCVEHGPHPSFAVSALGQPDGVEKIITVLVASAAGFAFFLVGRGIWRDLRRRSSAEPEEKPTEER
jgi:hypothetical protein